jgi:hypothetical protein
VPTPTTRYRDEKVHEERRLRPLRDSGVSVKVMHEMEIARAARPRSSGRPEEGGFDRAVNRKAMAAQIVQGWSRGGAASWCEGEGWQLGTDGGSCVAAHVCLSANKNCGLGGVACCARCSFHDPSTTGEKEKCHEAFHPACVVRAMHFCRRPLHCIGHLQCRDHPGDLCCSRARCVAVI